MKGVYLFGIDRTVQNVLPEGDYGLYFTLLGLGMLLQVIADFGLQLYNSRTISGHRQLLAKYFPYFVGLKMVLGAAFYVALLVVALVLGYRGWEIGLLLLAGTGQFLNSFVIYLRSSLAGLGYYTLDGWFSILDKLLMIVFIGGLLLWAPERLTVFLFAGAQVLCWVLTAATLLFLLSGKLPRKLPKFRRATFLMLLRGGAPYALAVLLQLAYTRMDVLMIERLLPAGAVAADHYAAGYRILDALNVIGWLLAGLLLPMYARLYARKEDYRSLLKFSVHLLVAGGLIAGIALAAHAQPLVYLLYDFAEARTGNVLFYLSLTFIFLCLNYAYGALLSATGHIGRMNYVFVAGILLNVIGNLWVLPRHGAAGAAAVTFVTQGFVAVTQAVLAHRWLKIPIGTVGWWRLAVLAGVLVAIAEFSPRGYASGFLPNLFILVTAGTATAFFLRLIDFREVMGFLRKR